jgi:hypothetical protein
MNHAENSRRRSGTHGQSQKGNHREATLPGQSPGSDTNFKQELIHIHPSFLS